MRVFFTRCARFARSDPNSTHLPRTRAFSHMPHDFQGKRPPQTASPAGYAWIIDNFDLRVPTPRRLTGILNTHHKTDQRGWLLLTPKHAPKPTLATHLEFALKWEGVNLAVLAALGSALCFAESAVLVRVLPPVHPVAMNAVGMTAGAAALLAGGVVAGESFVLPEGSATWAASVYLVTLGSVGVFFLYLFVLGRWTASRAAYAFLLSPIASISLSAWLDDEPVGPGLVVGGLLVLAGVYVGALRAPAPPAQPEVGVARGRW